MVLMPRIKNLALLLLLFLVFDVSSASVSTKFRKLIDDDNTPQKDSNSTAVQVNPLPNPVSTGKEPDPVLTSNDQLNDKNSKEPQMVNNSSTSVPDGSSKPDSVNPLPDSKGVNGTEPENRPPETKIDNGNEGSNQTEPVIPPKTTADNGKDTQESKGKDSVNPSPKISKEKDKTDQVNPSPKISKEDGENKEGSSTKDQVQQPPTEKAVDNNTKDLMSPPVKNELESPPLNKPDTGMNKEKEKNENGSSEQPGNGDTCAGLLKCTDKGALVACTETLKTDSSEWIILVQNGGERPLKVKIVVPSVGSPLKELEISKHQTERVNIPMTDGKIDKLVLDAGRGECVLHRDPPVSSENFFLRLPSYDKLVTPINGAYFLIFTVITFGGTWVCYLCRKRKRQGGGGVPYQELEMALPESFNAHDEETAQGWDEGWDDDWDESNAVKSPGGGQQHVGNISANGLTSRSVNKDGWDDDWDD